MDILNDGSRVYTWAGFTKVQLIRKPAQETIVFRFLPCGSETRWPFNQTTTRVNTAWELSSWSLIQLTISLVSLAAVLRCVTTLSTAARETTISQTESQLYITCISFIWINNIKQCFSGQSSSCPEIRTNVKRLLFCTLYIKRKDILYTVKIN